MWIYIGNIISALSQVLNTVFLFGDPNESISGRCYRQSWLVPMKIINTVFSPFSEGEHCRGAYNHDITQAKIMAEWPTRVPGSEPPNS